MYEDASIILEDKLNTIFSDDDFDKLIFSASGHKNLEVVIHQENGTLKFTPKKDWFGTELITFYANDSYSIPAIEIVEVYVRPVNDLPKIVQVGDKYTLPGYPKLDFIVYQNDWLNLTINVEDVDGDVARGNIIYFINITPKQNFYLEKDQLHFNPSNSDVGIHHINLSITDGNETPIEYISQQIRIIVLNVNDPPSVEIISPLIGSEFFKDKNITFSCIGSDIDLLILDSTESLTFQWTTNVSKFNILGTDKDLVNLSLDPGYYNVSVTVSDSSEVTASDYVHILVKDKDIPPEIPGQNPSGKKTSESYLWAWIIIIIIIIIVILVVVFLFLKKKKEQKTAVMTVETERGGALHTPVVTQLRFKPTQQPPLTPPQPNEPTSQPMPRPQPPSPQPAQVTVTDTEIQPISTSESKDIKEELEILDDLWMKGLVSQEEYQRKKNELMGK
jgi:uncharacterized membrane protein